MKQSAIIVVIAFAVFFAGRFTAPVKEVEDTRKIDSLTKDIAKRDRRETVLKDSVKFFRIMSDTWFEQAMKKQDGKIVTRTIYNNEKIRIDSLDTTGLSAEFSARYPVK